MKKLYYLIILTVILGLVLTGCLLSNVGQVPTTGQSGITYLTKGETKVIPLLAGQNIPVGTVTVSDDGTNLYVTYLTTGDWEMTKTHLYVGKTNPTELTSAPGQFPYSEPLDTPTSHTYIIPIAGIDSYNISEKGKKWVAEGSTGVEPGGQIYIAAHAKVQLPQLSDPITASVASGDTSGSGDVLLDNVIHIAEDSGNLEYPIGYPGPYVVTPSPAVLTWVHGDWPTIAGAQWISSAFDTEDPRNNSWRLFTRSLEIPLNAVNITGTAIMMTADNAEEVHLNGGFVGSDGEVYGPFVDNHEWNTVLSYSVIPQPGATLEVMVRNYAGSGGNPTGLIYKMDYEYQLLLTYLTETAWAGISEGEHQFGGKNWATYFTYDVQGI